MRYTIHYSCLSHIGNARRINQDNFACDGRCMKPRDAAFLPPLCGTKKSRENALFGIFDGLGGESCGEMAAYIAAKDACELKKDKKSPADLARFCRRANADICSYAATHEISTMGTTVAMIAFSRNRITLCNIGDSKIFRLRDGQSEQLSEDHVAVAAFGVKPPLSQNLGIPPDELIIEPYFARQTYRDGDIYLICSDGLTDMVTTERITEILTSEPFEHAVTQLLAEALANGGKDNTTIILCKLTRNRFFKRLHHRKRKEE